jgi:asparagine synthetase B (glutamine-hydrolysing)
MDSMQDFDDIALLLSGGKDSRMLACLLKEMGKDVSCYTYIGRHSTYEENELKVAKKVAKKLGFSHETIELNWNSYYDTKLIPKIIKAADGVPMFQMVLTMATIRPQISEDMLITGDLVTEYLDTAEYRPWKDGKDIKSVLFNRENLLVKTPEDQQIADQLKSMYDTNDVNTMILVRKSDRIIRAQVYKKLGYKVFHPALDEHVLNHTFSLPMKQRTDGYLARTIVKETDSELFKLRTTRSPFSLRFPLSFHIAYGKIMNTGVNNTPIPGSFDDENAKIENKTEKYRDDNYRWWKSLNE